MTDPFDSDELKRLNQTPAERLIDWAEENFRKHDYGPARGKQVGYQLMSENEDKLYAFIHSLSPEEQQEIGRKQRIIEGEPKFLELVLEMLEHGYETDSMLKARLAGRKQSQLIQKRSDCEDPG
jgi:hypothetical protein